MKHAHELGGGHATGREAQQLLEGAIDCGLEVVERREVLEGVESPVGVGSRTRQAQDD